MDMKVEAVAVVSDIDPTVGLDESLGRRLDPSFPGDAGFGVEPLTTPGAACSIIFGSGDHLGRAGLG